MKWESINVLHRWTPRTIGPIHLCLHVDLSLLIKWGVKHLYSTVLHPGLNGDHCAMSKSMFEKG